MFPRHLPDFWQNSGRRRQLQKQDIAADTSLIIDEIIERHKIVDWQRNPDVKNKMIQDIENYLYSIKGRCGLDLSFEDMDEIIELSIDIASERYCKGNCNNVVMILFFQKLCAHLLSQSVYQA